jgi:hypothetical protein
MWKIFVGNFDMKFVISIVKLPQGEYFYSFFFFY